MENKIEPSAQVLAEALALSQDILDDFELSRNRIENIYYKIYRLCRLLNDYEMQKIIQYEIFGYKSNNDSLSAEVFQLAVSMGREKDSTKEKVIVSSIGMMESQIENDKMHFSTAIDPHISISSSNPNQYVTANSNQTERNRLSNNIYLNTRIISTSKAYMYKYVLEKNLELKFSEIPNDIFSRVRIKVDSLIKNLLPESLSKFTSIYNNLQSENNEDWSNAVHGCRRILKDLADALFPATTKNRIKGKKTIALGQENYINRLVCFIEDSSDSEKYKSIVGSNLQDIGNKLDSIYEAANKGSHDTITSKVEADRYVVYTYLLIGDILSLLNEKED